MAKNNKYICGINPKALEKYAKKFFKQQGHRAYVKNDGGKIYFACNYFAAVIPAAAYSDLFQPITMMECPKDGEIISRCGAKENGWKKCGPNTCNIKKIIDVNFTKFHELRKTEILYTVKGTHGNPDSDVRIFQSQKFISALNTKYVDIFDMSVPLFQEKPTSPIFGQYDDEFHFLILPVRINQNIFSQFSCVTDSKNNHDTDESLVQKYMIERDVAKADAFAAREEIKKLKKELEKAQAAAKAAQEAQQAAEKHEEKQKREVMASPKERRITHKKENRPNKEQAAEKTDSQKEQAPKVMEVPDGKQSASMVEVIKSLESLERQ